MKGKSVWAVAAALACLLLGLGGCTPGLSEDLPLEEMIQRGDTAWWDGDEERARAFYETAVKVYPAGGLPEPGLAGQGGVRPGGGHQLV